MAFVVVVAIGESVHLSSCRTGKPVSVPVAGSALAVAGDPIRQAMCPGDLLLALDASGTYGGQLRKLTVLAVWDNLVTEGSRSRVGVLF